MFSFDSSTLINNVGFATTELSFRYFSSDLFSSFLFPLFLFLLAALRPAPAFCS